MMSIFTIDVETVITRLFSSDDPVDQQSYFSAESECSSEQHLWWEVLRSAIEDYQHFIGSPRTIDKYRFKEVFDWFFNPLMEEDSYIGSFENVCSIFNIEPSYIRKAMVIWTKQNYHKGLSRGNPNTNTYVSHYIDIKSLYE